jgi:hypothetical protein
MSWILREISPFQNFNQRRPLARSANAFISVKCERVIANAGWSIVGSETISGFWENNQSAGDIPPPFHL